MEYVGSIYALMAERKLLSKFFEDILTIYNIVLSMKELTSASEGGAP